MDFGHRAEPSFDGVLRLAFCLDTDLEQQVGVEVRQHGGRLDLVVHGEGDLDAVTRQVARVVSADGDGAAYAAVCAADPVLAALHAAAPGFRPSSFHSPYDACVWAVLSARRQRRQAIGLRARLSAEHGRTFELAGQQVAALPTPQTLARLDHVAGLHDAAVPRLHAIAEAATAGRLDVERLTALEAAAAGAAAAELQRLPGIVPFYASLVLVRACGLTDVLAVPAHTRDAVRRVYGLDHLPSDEEVAALAESWRPFRTWVAVALRAVGTRVGTGPGRGAAA